MGRAPRRPNDSGFAELRAARRVDRPIYAAVAVFSFFANLLMLTGPIYMLQVYDRVLGSGSVETLVSLSLIAAYLFVTMAIIDIARHRLLSRVGARFEARLAERVMRATIARSRTHHDATPEQSTQALQLLRNAIASPAFMAAYDLPWTPIFLIGIAIFHPALGLLAVLGGAILIALALGNQLSSRHPQTAAQNAQTQTDELTQQFHHGADTIAATGMESALIRLWRQQRDIFSDHQVQALDVTALFGTSIRTMRIFLQTALLGLGAYLVIQNDLSPGAMIAASVLTGRALSPVETIISAWPSLDPALRGWTAVGRLLSDVPPVPPRTPLPEPRSRVDVCDLTVVPPNQSVAALRLVSFSVGPGQVIGVIGPSGSGKSTLAKALTGVWPAAGGLIRLDGAPLAHYDQETLGRSIGALPQTVQMFHGTIAENIAGFAEPIDLSAVYAAAQVAQAHEMILTLPEGYDTRLRHGETGLSGGQLQRIALARAVYGDPKIVILDEPNAHLDHDGEAALLLTIRQLKSLGKACIVMTHRPAALQDCDAVLVLEGGRRVAFGPRDDVLKKVLLPPNSAKITAADRSVS
ncbi:type I secretion system permease/ATPase [Pseudooceanicola sp. MF1-13]|uniref:type I secretion system permease/ATPase n=1 Tax=Pseudooceanicola sp. MF1-13 TaxID=3379095 RepID=UPI003891AAF5